MDLIKIKCNRCKKVIHVKIFPDFEENIVCKNCDSIIKYPNSFRIIYKFIMCFLTIIEGPILYCLGKYMHNFLSNWSFFVELVVRCVSISLVYISSFILIMGIIYMIMIKLYKL